jgi:hypothetical protein
MEGYDAYIWNKYGPDNTTMPEPTQHALEKSQQLRDIYGPNVRTEGLTTGRSFLDYEVPDRYKVPDRLKNSPPGTYTVSADEVLPDYAKFDAALTMDMFNHIQEDKVLEKTTADALERQAGRLMEQAAALREKYARFGEDDFSPGSVIIFDKVFYEYNGRPLPKPSKAYFYAAIKAPDGLWSTTGPRAPKSYTWDELIRWMGEGVTEVYYVTEMEKFVG